MGAARRNDLYGIVNGLDYDEFNPMTDKYMDVNFSIDTVEEGKKANKKALQNAMGLPEREDAFLIGMVSRMTDQKGFDLVAYVMEEILSTMMHYNRNILFCQLLFYKNNYSIISIISCSFFVLLFSSLFSFFG